MSLRFGRQTWHVGALFLCGILFSTLALPAATQQGRAIAWSVDPLHTNVPPDLTNVIAVAAGSYHSLALRADGTVAGWGDDSQGKATPPNNLSNVVAISAGAQHSLALLRNGRVVAWGDNSGRQTNVPAGLASVAAISAGQFHSLALLSNGVVVAWGSGPGTNVPLNLRAVAVAAGGNHSLALRGDGTVAGWGQNTFGQANTTGLSQILGIAAGDDFSVYILNNRTVTGRGNPAQGRTTPPAGLSGVVALSAGAAHCVALRDNGRVVSWGDNTSGQTNVPTTFTRWISASAGFSHSVGVAVIPPTISTQPQSQTVTVGTPVNFSVVVNGSAPLSYRWRKNGNFIAGATSPTYSIASAQTNDAGNYTVVVTNLSGSVTSAVATLTVNARPAIVEQPQSATVGVGWSNVFRVTAAGTAPLRYRWRHQGTNIPNATNAAYTNINVQTRHAGNYVVVVTNNFGAITSEVATLTVIGPPLILTQPQSQTVVAGSPVSFSVVATNAAGYQWRRNGDLISGANDAQYNIVSVQSNNVGQYSVLVTNLYGSVLSQNALLTLIPRGSGPSDLVGWGESNIWNGFTYVDLTPPPLTGVRAISAGLQHSLVLLENGTVLAWGVNTHGQASTPPGLANVVEISAGGFHNLARTASGSIVAWGLDDFDQSTVPPQFPTNIVAIAAGGYHSLVLLADGTVAGWGKGTQSLPPPSVGKATRIAAGIEHSLAVKTNTAVAGWGTNNLGQARPPNDLTNVIAIAAGENHSLALRSDGTVVAWGANNLGQTNVPPGLSGVIAIAAGANHCLALKSDRTVVAWGHNNFGQQEVPTNLPPVIAIAAGGDRSLALTRSLLRLSAPLRFGNQIRVAVEMANGTDVPHDRGQAARVRFTTDPSLPPASWLQLPQGLSFTNNIWSFDDTVTEPRRFYLLFEPSL